MEGDAEPDLQRHIGHDALWLVQRGAAATELDFFGAALDATRRTWARVCRRAPRIAGSLGPDKLNAMNRQLSGELHDAVKRMDGDETIGWIVVTGAGDQRIFGRGDIHEQREDGWNGYKFLAFLFGASIAQSAAAIRRASCNAAPSESGLHLIWALVPSEEASTGAPPYARPLIMPIVGFAQAAISKALRRGGRSASNSSWVQRRSEPDGSRMISIGK